MDTTLLALWGAVVLVALLAVAGWAVAGWLLLQRRRSGELRERFGPEYRRAVQEAGNRQQAEAELAARQKRVEGLQIRPLTSEQRERFEARWRKVQAQFVDKPGRAIAEAERLVTEVMKVRGYPVGEYDQQLADISVDHGNVADHYRAARQIALANERDQATTEDLRQALIHYRALFEDLLEPRLEQPRKEGLCEAAR